MRKSLALRSVCRHRERQHDRQRRNKAVFVAISRLLKELDCKVRTAVFESIIRSLAGNWHHVYTGITVINTRSGRILRNVDKTRVHLVPMTEQEIDAYVATGEPLDKAGAYGIQGMGGIFVDRIDGSYSNVVGLPMSMLRIMLAQVGGVDERGVI